MRLSPLYDRRGCGARPNTSANRLQGYFYMRAVAHAAIAGVSAFGGVALLKRQYPDARLPDPIFAGFVAAIAAGLPDYLEPATTPHHRQFCHSVAFAGLLIAGMKKLYSWQPTSPGEMLLR